MLLYLALTLSSACLSAGTFSVVLFSACKLMDLAFWAFWLHFLPLQSYPCTLVCVYIPSPAGVFFLVGCFIFIVCVVCFVCVVCIVLICLGVYQPFLLLLMVFVNTSKFCSLCAFWFDVHAYIYWV